MQLGSFGSLGVVFVGLVSVLLLSTRGAFWAKRQRNDEDSRLCRSEVNVDLTDTEHNWMMCFAENGTPSGLANAVRSTLELHSMTFFVHAQNDINRFVYRCTGTVNDLDASGFFVPLQWKMSVELETLVA